RRATRGPGKLQTGRGSGELGLRNQHDSDGVAAGRGKNLDSDQARQGGRQGRRNRGIAPGGGGQLLGGGGTSRRGKHPAARALRSKAATGDSATGDGDGGSGIDGLAAGAG